MDARADILKILFGLLTITIANLVTVSAHADEKIDASDPTKIYTYAGGGIKYTDYTNGESMTEVRATGNIGLSKKDMVLFELGYGKHSGDLVPGDNSGLTNSRIRWSFWFWSSPRILATYCR